MNVNHRRPNRTIELKTLLKQLDINVVKIKIYYKDFLITFRNQENKNLFMKILFTYIDESALVYQRSHDAYYAGDNKWEFINDDIIIIPCRDFPFLQEELGLLVFEKLCKN
jgi:hypothetical protein